jgi:dTDP-4-amino-4,6-dideoxygalactose transaminase
MYRGLPSAAPEHLHAAETASYRVLCLPIYPNLDLAVIDRVAQTIISLLL